MPKYTLDKCSEVFNDAIIMQKFGTTEVGTLRSKSKILIQHGSKLVEKVIKHELMTVC